jgi:hypothetical protein
MEFSVARERLIKLSFKSTSGADEDDTKIYDLYDEARTNNPSTPTRPDSRAGKRDDAMHLLEDAFRGRPLQRSIPLKVSYPIDVT